MFHDHDDVMRKGALPRFIEELEARPDVKAVRGMSKDFISPDVDEKDMAGISLKSEPYYGLFSGTTLMRREVWDVIGAFDENYRAGEFHDWMVRMKDNGFTVVNLDFEAVARRIHLTNFGRTDRNTEYSDYAKLLRRQLLAKRAAAANSQRD